MTIVGVFVAGCRIGNHVYTMNMRLFFCYALLLCWLAAGFAAARPAATVSPPANGHLAARERGRGGPMGFLAGCCFGIRAAADYNDRQDMHWREFGRWMPGLGLAVALWDGIDGYLGYTRVELSARHGSVFFGAVFY